MGIARVRISQQLFLQTFHFPSGTEIKHVRPEYGGGYIDIECVVSHPDLKDVPLGEHDDPPLVMPTFRKTSGQDVEFVSWGES